MFPPPGIEKRRRRQPFADASSIDPRVRTAPADQEIHDFQQDAFLLVGHRKPQGLQPGKDGALACPSLLKPLTKALAARSASSWPLLFNIRTISSSSLNATPQ
jgi:hypothetical protein